MKKSTIAGVAGLLLIGFSAFTFYASSEPNAEDESLKTTENKANLPILPDASFALKLQDSKGNTLDMHALKGKKIFMNYWASWCPPCLAEMPGINSLYENSNQDEVAFLLISLDDNFQKAIDYRDRKGYSFEVYRATSSIPAMYRSQSIPITFLINASGKLALTQSGMGEFDSPEFKRYFDGL